MTITMYSSFSSHLVKIKRMLVFCWYQGKSTISYIHRDACLPLVALALPSSIGQICGTPVYVIGFPLFALHWESVETFTVLRVPCLAQLSTPLTYTHQLESIYKDIKRNELLCILFILLFNLTLSCFFFFYVNWLYISRSPPSSSIVKKIKLV